MLNAVVVNVVLGHITTKNNFQSENKTSHCDSVDVMTVNYNDGVCEGNAQLGEKVLWKTLQVEWMFSLWNVSISIIAVQFNGRRCLLQSNVLINRRYLSLASLLLPMTVAMTLSQ